VRRAALAGLVTATLVAAVLAATALLPADGDDNANGASGARRAATKPLVVMLVLDEFPVDDIVLPDGRIDAARFPNFAALAGTSTWFPNATSVYDSTFKAVPAILDAKLPVPGSAPDIRSHKHSLYTLFNELGWDVQDTESGTAICPTPVCRGAHTRRPGVLLQLSGGGRPARLERWIKSIRRRSRPTLYFQHALLPHEPWIYLPSGRQSRPRGNDPIGGINRPIGFHDRDLSVHNHQRHLLQAGFVDHELGKLISRLRRTGVFDRAVIAVTADHGYAFEIGVNDRRLVTESNVEQIAPVPLFIKAPRQRRGSVNPSYVRTIDVVPTIAGLLHAKLDWRHDGASVFTRAAQRRHSVSMVTRAFDRTIRIGSREFERRRVQRREEWARLFGTGFESSVRYGSPWAQLYRSGPNAELIGQPATSVRNRTAGSARIANSALLRNVKPSGRLFPTRLTGTLSGGAPGTRRDLAAAVGGRIVAVGRSFYLRGQRSEYFSMMLPEESLQSGRNPVELIEVAQNGARYRLARL
jgi:hypothetical protein